MRCYLLLLFLSLHFSLFAQEQTPQDTLRTLDIAPITVSASRFEAQYNRLPFAISVLNKSQIQRAQAQLSLNESLVAVPGVFTLNPDNFSQDLRISIRGFGARAAFGIRGIRLFVDGLPESTPDGQADVDNVDAGALQRMELLRGASAGLYGNASGGVLNFSTEEPSQKAFAESQAILGSFGFQRYQLKTGFKVGKLGVFASASQNRMEGYRAQSAMQQTTLNLKLRYQLSDNTRLSLLVNYGKSPYAEDAGGLTSEQVSADRRQARAANVQFNAGEEVAQGRVGLVFEKQFSANIALQPGLF
ncbi:TonB-dependent receptor plug domain-containing protein [Haliscomenobacter sp.]|uniref:TonB-dependent receptor plug domain-containing protein n=1 Tax=Haliscomenobacter sp. TaxID=2717303 RepID=UPI003BAA68F3